MNFSADCSQCAALCCSAFAFEAGPDFADDKPAEANCRHLAADYGCRIHETRVARGYRGCIAYDCQGAGPAATALFPRPMSGRDETESVTRARYESFRILRTVHALAATLKRPEVPQALRQALWPEIDPDEGWSYAALLDFDRSGARSRILGEIARVLRPLRAGGGD